jgi:ADP-ribosylglycohydrolase
MINKILGGLYGQALGDAWAMPALLRPEHTWERYGGWITEFKPGPADHPVHHGLHAGQITDDTEQAFSLAKEFIKDGKVTPEGVARGVIAWYEMIDGDNSPYVGPSTRKAVSAIKAGKPLEETGKNGDTNGSAMRVSPVGLIHPGDLEGAVRDAHVSCIPTHNTDVAISGACAVAGAIAVAMVDGTTLDEIIAAGKKAADMGRKFGYTWLGASVSRRIEMAVDIVRKDMSEVDRLQELYDVVGCTLAIPDSVGSAFGIFAMANGDPKQCAIYAAQASGDADTVAAMACAIAGAWKGVGAFEQDIIDTLLKANPDYDFYGVAEGLLKLTEA